MIKKVLTALYIDDNILYFNEDSGDAILSCNKMGILSVDLNINLDDTNYDEDDPEAIIYIRLLTCILNLKNVERLKKSVMKI